MLMVALLQGDGSSLFFPWMFNFVGVLFHRRSMISKNSYLLAELSRWKERSNNKCTVLERTGKEKHRTRSNMYKYIRMNACVCLHLSLCTGDARNLFQCGQLNGFFVIFRSRMFKRKYSLEWNQSSSSVPREREKWIDRWNSPLADERQGSSMIRDLAWVIALLRVFFLSLLLKDMVTLFELSQQLI